MSRAEITAYCIIIAMALILAAGLLADLGMAGLSFACGACAVVLLGVVMTTNGRYEPD